LVCVQSNMYGSPRPLSRLRSKHFRASICLPDLVQIEANFGAFFGPVRFNSIRGVQFLRWAGTFLMPGIAEG
jgi:hypothetical protein